MTKTGIVTQVNKNIIYLMTSGGEFVRVKLKGAAPNIGEIYSGEAYIERKVFRLPAIAAAMFAFMILSSGLYTYYTPVAAITIDINPSVKLDINRWNRIIKATPLNEDGEKILTNLSLANKSPEKGLELIVSQAEKDNFINEDYKSKDKAISVHVVEKKEDQINLSGFQAAIEKQNLKVTIKEEIKDKKDNSKENTKAADKTIDNSDKNGTKSSNPQSNDIEESEAKNRGQEKKEEKDNPNDDLIGDNDKINDKSKNPNSGANNGNNEKNNGNSSSNNQSKSDKEDKNGSSQEKKDNKEQGGQSDKKNSQKDDKKDKDSKPNSGNSSGNNSNNQKENKK
jgi:hypothetical protein